MAPYSKNMSKKLKKMKKIVRSANVEAALRDDRFHVELNRIHDIYPDHEGRENLFELVGEETKFVLAKIDILLFPI